MKSPLHSLCLLSGILAAALSAAAVELASPFGDHMVLQRGIPVPVWGWASPDATVTIAFAGQAKTATADASGAWRVTLDPMPASAESRDFLVTGDGAITLRDVLVGEVWLCGGQSNMERHLGLQAGQKPIINWESEVAAADHPLIRQLYVTQTRANTPQAKVEASWSVCTPANVVNFTAVGYFFARDLQAKLGVPVGILHSSWGGTPAEAWTSRTGLAKFPEFDSALASLGETDEAVLAKRYEAALAAWYQAHDPGLTAQPAPWFSPDAATTDWPTMNLPTTWEDAGHDGFDGLGWFRRSFDLPAGWAGHDLELRLGAVDDIDTTWVNGRQVGSTSGWTVSRVYRIPAAALRATGNVIAVRVLDTGGNGGIWNPKDPLEIVRVDGQGEPIDLRGPWGYQLVANLKTTPYPPADWRRSSGTPTVLYNGMIAPLEPYALRGITFYQGESNAGNPTQYRTLFPALIQDWREHWNRPDLPFLFVQIAPFKGQPPEIREAQLLALKSTPHTAMAVTVDVGDADDIHPANKGPVGARLALAARVLAYGESIEYSGPIYQSAEFQGDHAIVHFTHTAQGMVAPGGELVGFTIAGDDGVFHPARATIDGRTVRVSASDVPHPTAVRYAWANVAEGNLFNTAGLPASPFRTDVK